MAYAREPHGVYARAPLDASPTESRWDHCPVCASPQRREYVRFDEVRFDECERCGSVYKAFERAALLPEGFYEASYFHGRKSGRDKRFEHRVRKSMRWLSGAQEAGREPGPGQVLDVGCSFGYVLEAAKRLGHGAAGVDVSQYAVKVCRERGYEAHAGTLERLPLEAGRFTLAHLKHVLEHTATPGAALAEVSRVCAPGAALLVAVPDLDYWKGRRRRRTYRYFRPDDLGAQHYVYYSVESLCRLLEANGFQVVARSKAFFRARFAARSFLHRLFEALRYGVLAAAYGAARALGLTREVFVLARKA